jgi:hypothetical protein
MARMPIATGIPIPSAMPRISLASMEVPSGAGGDDEEVGGCMVRVDEGKVVAVAEGKVVAVAEGKVVAVAEDDPD